MNSKFTCEHCEKNHNSLENLNRHISCDQTCEKYTLEDGEWSLDKRGGGGGGGTMDEEEEEEEGQ